MVSGTIACVGDGIAVNPSDAGSEASNPTDGQVADVSPPDATPADAGSCWDRKFNAPVLMAAVNSAASDTFPRLAPDELTLYFGSVRNSDAGSVADIFMAKRANLTDSFGSPSSAGLVSAVSWPSTDEGSPTVSADGLTLIYCSDQPDRTQYHLFSATRLSAQDPFSAGTLIANANLAPNFDCYPFLRLDSAELLFVSNRPGGPGKGDIYRAANAGGGAFAAASEVTDLNTPADEVAPVLSADGLVVLFASDRSGGGAKGGLDVWMAKRSTLSSPFGAAVNVSEVNTPLLDAPGWISSDGCRLYMHSGVGPYHLYLAQR